jgi:hypothetical protein
VKDGRGSYHTYSREESGLQDVIYPVRLNIVLRELVYLFSCPDQVEISSVWNGQIAFWSVIFKFLVVNDFIFFKGYMFFISPVSP